MSRFHLVAGLLMLLVLSLCGGCRDTSSPLVGTWKTGRITTDWGDAETIVVFTKEAVTVTFVPVEGEPMGGTSKYEIRDGTIVSDSLNGGTPMPFSISGDELVVIDRSSQETRLFRR
jgi:hypothetical protein